MKNSEDRSTEYESDSLSLIGAVSLGTGVMIGAGIFALTGQMAQMSGVLFPLAFLSAALVVAFGAYSYIKLSNTYPSAGGIGMYLHKAYGSTLPTAFNALLMYFSMVIAQSFLARTFGSYTVQLIDTSNSNILIPGLGVGLLVVAFIINLFQNRIIEGIASFIGFIKLGGIILFGGIGLWLSDTLAIDFSVQTPDLTLSGFLGATALGILAFKGFTTITNSGSELKDPHRNVGRAIMISIVLCVIIYTLVGFAVANNLSISEIIATRDYSLAAAAQPVLGDFGLWFTVLLAIVATAGGVIASIFAVSRMLAMLTDMKLVPHSHFGMPGTIQKHTLVYTVALGIVLTIFFDLSRIASLGIIFYLVMDIAIHWGVLRYLRKEVDANIWILTIAIILDFIVLIGFIYFKLTSDFFVVAIAAVSMILILVVEIIFLNRQPTKKNEP
ncbi:MAG: APC family permease [Sulfurimonas sp.]